MLRQFERDVTDLAELQFLLKLRALIEDESVSVRYHLDNISMIEPGEHLGLLVKVGLNFCLGLLGLVGIDLNNFECDHVSSMVLVLLAPRIHR